MNTEAIEAPQPMTLEQINAAINEQRDALARAIKVEQSRVSHARGEIKKHRAALAQLPRPPIKRTRKAKDGAQ